MPFLESPVRIGELVAGKYRVDRILGEGGMGVVVAATHVGLDEQVALKFLRREAAAQPVSVERFLREARAAARIKSEHVARVTDVGTLDDGLPYIVMEYLEGEDLSERLERRGALSNAEAVDVILQVCEALADAHRVGIVHRDLKPSNLFVTHRGDGSVCVKVLDFGISKILPNERGAQVDITTAQDLMGTPLYMSPEQMRFPNSVDRRTDIWSLGVVLYELLTKRYAFDGDNVTQVCGAVLQDAPRSIHELEITVPQGLEMTILRCLEKETAARFQDVPELAMALAPYATKEGHECAARIARIAHGTHGGDHELGAPAPPESSIGDQAWGATTARVLRPRRKWATRALFALSIAGAFALGGLVLRIRLPDMGSPLSRLAATSGPSRSAAGLPRQEDPTPLTSAEPASSVAPFATATPAQARATQAASITSKPNRSLRPTAVAAKGSVTTAPSPVASSVTPLVPPKTAGVISDDDVQDPYATTDESASARTTTPKPSASSVMHISEEHPAP